jgi:hypothetical protein
MHYAPTSKVQTEVTRVDPREFVSSHPTATHYAPAPEVRVESAKVDPREFVSSHPTATYYAPASVVRVEAEKVEQPQNIGTILLPKFRREPLIVRVFKAALAEDSAKHGTSIHQQKPHKLIEVSGMPLPIFERKKTIISVNEKRTPETRVAAPLKNAAVRASDSSAAKTMEEVLQKSDLGKKIYKSLRELQSDIDTWLQKPYEEPSEVAVQNLPTNHGSM